MSRPAALIDIAPHLERFGSLATLVTVNPDAAPHVGTVLVTVGQSRLSVRVGGRTREHILSNPSVTLSWLTPGSDYQLIVDGVAVVVDNAGTDDLFAVEIDVRRGILHRLAGRADGPTCQPLDAATAR